MTEPLHLLLISGSIRRFSFTRALTVELQDRLERQGAACTHWDPAERPLAICDPEYHHRPEHNPAPGARLLFDLAMKADGLVFASPVYHNSYSGVVKNVIDYLTIPQVQYKPIALLSHGGRRVTQAVDHLRIVGRGLLGVVLPTQVCSAREDFVESADGPPRLQDPDIMARLDRQTGELLAFAYTFRALRDRSKA
jgi:azobenzene reductase